MTNWKTTVIGFLASFWLIAQPIVTNGDFDIKRDWMQLVGAIITASLGYFSQDKKPTE